MISTRMKCYIGNGTGVKPKRFTCYRGDRVGYTDACMTAYDEYRQVALDLLKAYEDTGLTPEEIMEGKLLTGWIPVSEKLPEDFKLVLTCDDHKDINIMYHHKSFEEPFGISCDHPRLNKVAAWMPLPEPWEVPKNE